MKLNLLSNLFLAAVLASGAFGCKKKMDRVTPLPGYGAGSTIRDVGPGNGLNNGAIPPGTGLTGADVTGANVPKNSDGTFAPVTSAPVRPVPGGMAPLFSPLPGPTSRMVEPAP